MKLSRNEIATFLGDVRPLYLESEAQDLTHEPILWSVSGDAVSLREFSGDEKSPFNYGVTLSMHKVGEAVVTATYKGETYTCRVSVRERVGAEPDAAFSYYRGDLHTHTASTHTAEKFAAREHVQADCVRTLAQDERIDFGILSDHASVMRRKGFFGAFVEKELADPMATVVFPGSESEVTVLENDRFGLPHKHSGEIVVLNADNCSNAYDWQTFYNDMATSPAPVAIFAHPFVLGVGQNSLWSFPFSELRTPEMYRVMRGIEMGNGKNTGGVMLFEYAYSAALDNGFRVSPTCGSDSHGPVWGFDAMQGKTVLMACEKSREAFLDALLHNRFYACESGNVKLRFSVNGAQAPADLSLTEAYEISVALDYFTPDESTVPVCCQVISDYGVTVAELERPGNSFTLTVHSDTARYFYLRLVDAEGRKTWSCPVWTGRAFDAPQKAATYTPIVPEGFTAVECGTGADASAVIDGDPGVAFTSAKTTTSILIDMQKEWEIAALGYYVRRFTKDWIKATSVDWKAEIGARMGAIVSGYVTRYAISTSVDGVQFTPRATGTIRSFGDEQVIPMERHCARYVRFDALATVGAQSGTPGLEKATVNIGELSVFC